MEGYLKNQISCYISLYVQKSYEYCNKKLNDIVCYSFNSKNPRFTNKSNVVKLYS